MHHLEAVVVKRRSRKAESPPSTLRRTSGNIQMEFVRKSGSGSRSIGRGSEDMILPGREDPHNCVDPRNPTEVGKDRVCTFVV